MPDEDIVATPFQRVDREEIRTARMPGASVVGHGDSVQWIRIRRNARRFFALHGLRPFPPDPYSHPLPWWGLAYIEYDPIIDTVLAQASSR